VSYPPVVLDRVASLPLYRQIEVELRRAILDGRIGPGTVLPGIRSYARHLGVGAVTVMTAYDQLTAEGYLEARPGRGTVVAAGVSRPVPGPRRTHIPMSGRAPGPAAAVPPSPGFRRPFFGGSRSDPRFDFRPGAAGLELFPSAAWERLLPRAWRDLASDPGPATSYRWPEGDPRLRAELSAYLGMARSVRADRDQLVITSGAQGAFVAASATWLGPGSPLAVEDPGSPFLYRSFAQARVPLVHVPVDDRGLLVERLPDEVRAVLVTPSWQDPGGGTMPVARRMQLLRWAAAHDALVIEDDAAAEPQYHGHAQPSLQGLDDTGRVLYVGTFSRMLFPGLRVGFAVVPAGAVDAFLARHEAASRGPGALEQRALALFLAEGHFERHLVRLRAHHAERQAALLDALAAELGTVVSARPAAAGAHLVVRVEDVHLTATELATRARALGVAVEPLASYRHHPAGDQELLLHYARLSPDELRAGVRVLARAAAPRAAVPA
jgi:GntR family transcriptional regulator / MocR family aminotransferase